MKNDEILALFHMMVALIRRTPPCHKVCPPPQGECPPPGAVPPPPPIRHPFRERGRILITLERENGITQKRLAELLGIRPQSLSELIYKLESDGLITRVCNEQDKRETLVYISDAGKACLEEIKAKREMFATEFLSPLTDEEKVELTRLLTKLANAQKK